MRHYCSLFDSKYLTRGLVLYESLERWSSEPFELHVLAMDDQCLEALRGLKLPHALVTSLRVFEAIDPNGLEVIRESRTWTEYCWTLASNFTEFLFLFEPDYQEMTYLDSDLYFFNNPEPIFEEIGERSIAITPHRLIPSKKHLESNGIFNVGWVTFRNTPVGRECLSTWAAQVRERCSAQVGCGDQKYLDEWPELYGDEVCILPKGVNVGPWSLANYDLSVSMLRDPWTVRVDGEPLVAYHFHEYVHNERLTNYPLRQIDKDLIYSPYQAAVERAQKQVEAIHLHQ